MWAQPTWLTDFRDDMNKIDVPALIVHGTADNISPIEAPGRRFAKEAHRDNLEIDGAPHGMVWTHAGELNGILLDVLSS